MRGVVLLAAALMLAAAPAEASRSFGDQYVNDPDGDGYAVGRGYLYVQVVTATNRAWVRTVRLNGKGGYTTAQFWNTRGSRTGVRSFDTSRTSFTDVTRSIGISAPTAGPWYGAVKTCINVSFWFDPCTRESSGRL